MVCAIHQPNFLPYGGFFDKIQKSDIFIIYDDAQFVKRNYHNRNSILLDGRIFRLNVPVLIPKKYAKINEVRIKQNFLIKRMNWKDYHLLQIKNAYKDSKYFKNIFPKLKGIYDKNHLFLMDLNMDLINLFCNLLNIKVDFRFSSRLTREHNIIENASSKLLKLCLAVNATTYLSGVGGKNYLEESLFESSNIRVIYQEFKAESYPQLSKEFIKNLSIIDYLFSK